MSAIDQTIVTPLVRPGPAFAVGSVGSQEAFDRLAFSLESQLDGLCAAVLAGCAEPAGPGANSPHVSPEELRELVCITVTEELSAFARETLPERRPDSSCFAVDLDLLLGVYRSAHMVLWQAWFDLVENAALGGRRRRELLRRGSDFLFAYTGALSDLAAKDSHRHLAAGTDQQRLQAVRTLLQGESSVALVLGLDLDFHHLGLIAWGEDARGAVASVAGLLGRPQLAVSPMGQQGTCWAWLSGARPLRPEQEDALRQFSPSGARVALGLEAPGEEGFRASHRQALRARRFAPRSGPPLIHYADIAVEALAAENEEDARAFVANELRGIEDDSSRSCLIRETLEAYFAAEYNAACAGAMLGIHQQTVANRLRAAEERLGQPSIRARRVELEMALRLRATLSPSDSQPAVSAS